VAAGLFELVATKPRTEKPPFFTPFASAAAAGSAVRFRSILFLHVQEEEISQSGDLRNARSRSRGEPQIFSAPWNRKNLQSQLPDE
jgi:hypothetical protein